MFHYSNFGKFGEDLKKYADLDGYVPECQDDIEEMDWPEGWEDGLDESEYEFVQEAIYETKCAVLNLWRWRNEIHGMTLEGEPGALQLRYESYCNEGGYILTYKLDGRDVADMATWLVDLAAKCEDGLDAGEHAVEWFGLEDPTLTQNAWTFAAVCEHEGVTLEWC